MHYIAVNTERNHIRHGDNGHDDDVHDDDYDDGGGGDALDSSAPRSCPR